VTFSWFFLSTLNYDARSTTHQINMMWLWVFQKVSQHWWLPSFLKHRLFIRRFVSRHQRWT